MAHAADFAILVFCKAPIPGQVKTRLTPLLTAQEAAQAHIELSLRTLALCCQNPLGQVQLHCAPNIDHPFFKAAAQRFPITLHQQQGDGLGARMHHAFQTALARHRHVLLLGCDCPSLVPGDLLAAQAALRQGHDIVLAPAEDGGYVLIGLNQPQPHLFDGMAWGTSTVLAQTQQRVNQLALSAVLLPMQWDVDRPEDWRRYQAAFPANR